MRQPTAPIRARRPAPQTAVPACRAGELRVVVQPDDHPPMAERGAPVAAAGHTEVAAKRYQRGVGPARHNVGEPFEVLRTRALVDHEHMPRHPGLRQRRMDRCRGFLGRSSARITTSASYGPSGAPAAPATGSVIRVWRGGDRQIGRPLDLPAAARPRGVWHQASNQGAATTAKPTRSPAWRWAASAPGRTPTCPAARSGRRAGLPSQPAAERSCRVE